MPNQKNPSGATWTSREAYLLALVSLISGLLSGYFLSSSRGTIPTGESLQPSAAPLLAAVEADPKNFEKLAQLGNLYYDHRVYPEAIEYYTRALELRPNDANVRTDLGTAYWYSGFPDKAVQEYEKSLSVDPTHEKTLFNLGVVRSEGFKDYIGAIAAWEKLLKTNPEYPEKQRVLDLIQKARSQSKEPG